MAAPIDALSERFVNLETSDRKVIVTPRVPKEGVITLHNHLKQIDLAYLTSVMLKVDMKNPPKLVSFIDSHAVTTPYSFSIQKCDKAECCQIIRTALEFRDLATQRQPTPRSDPNRPSHFFHRNQALAAAANNPNALSDLSEMPSSVGDEKKELVKKSKNGRQSLQKCSSSRAGMVRKAVHLLTATILASIVIFTLERTKITMLRRRHSARRWSLFLIDTRVGIYCSMMIIT